MSEFDLIIKTAEKSMGFAPSSLTAMSKKPNILGAFTMLFASIKGFQSSEVSAAMGLKMAIKNLKWTIQAKKERHLEVPAYLKDLIAHVTSHAAGCRYCQAHTAHTAHRNGVAIEKLQKVWEFHTSDMFSDEERAALRFAQAAGSVPNQVTKEHHADLEKYFSEKQIVEIVGTVSIFGFLNRWNDSMATKLEDKPLQFAKEYLSAHWDPGKHV